MALRKQKKVKQEKVLYNCKVATVQLNAVSGKHRVVESMDVDSGTFKLENYKQCTAGKLPQDSLTIPSIVRRAKFENLIAFIKKVQTDRDFVEKCLRVEEERIDRKRKGQYDLVELGIISVDGALMAA